jgi:hypothetical protein
LYLVNHNLHLIPHITQHRWGYHRFSSSSLHTGSLRSSRAPSRDWIWHTTSNETDHRWIRVVISAVVNVSIILRALLL